MVSRRHLFILLVLLLTTFFVLVACERPTPGRDDADDAAVVDDSGTEATDPNVGGGVESGYPAEEPADTGDTAEGGEPADSGETAEGGEPADSGETAEEPADSGDTAAEPAEGTDTTTEEPADSGEEAGGGAPTGDEAEGEAEGDVGGGTPETDASDTTQAEPAATEEQRHVVQAGENLYRIGLKYGVSWVTLASYNRITNANRIDVGQVIRIPPSGPTGGEPEPNPTPVPTTYTVKAGDNLFRIGLAYGISWTQIAEANGLINPNQIYVGQTLKIPTSAPGPTPPFTHTVQPGETLFRISLQYGVPWTSIAAENNIQSPYVIYPGQVLSIPGG